MAIVEISNNGGITIPTDIRKKYRIKEGSRVMVTDENGVITIRPTLIDAIKLAKRTLKRGA
ncbi:MAG: AbrB/MazE/SpoVT family DNA-binding domain-containing protein [Actinomycetota bacterium]|nr:AbrB/MazE/SpoVT family DNA-binding domain-containing protein [Actinomycetota bacterium]